ELTITKAKFFPVKKAFPHHNLHWLFSTCSLRSKLDRFGPKIPRFHALGNNFADVSQKPFVDLGEIEHFVDRHSILKRLRQMKNSLRIRNREFQSQYFWIDMFVCAIAAKTEALYLQTAQRLLQRFLERAANCHRFAHTFHPRRQRRVCLRKFFERKARNFYNAIIDRGLETSGRLACDVV